NGCMQLMNAIITEPEELEFRIHLRSEFMRTGLYDLIDDLRAGAEGSRQIQMTVFDTHASADQDEFLARFDDNLVMDTPAEPYLQSILQHLLYIKDDELIRPAFYKLIEECITQIVLHKNGYDPDFRLTQRFNIDVQPLIDGLIEKSRAEEERKIDELKSKLEIAIAARQEAEAKTAHLEERLKNTASGPSGVSQSSIAEIAKPQPDLLPYGLKPKKKWEVEGPLKRANWKTIIPAKMSEKAFWVKFSSKPIAKRNEDNVDKGHTMKKVKNLKVLDSKAAQNLSILLGGSLKHMSYEHIRTCILRCDTAVLTGNVLDLLIQHMSYEHIRTCILRCDTVELTGNVLDLLIQHMSYEHIRTCILRCGTAVLTGNVLDLLIQVPEHPAGRVAEAHVV
ncbi:putative diaphanous, partial [Operophtera brumata]